MSSVNSTELLQRMCGKFKVNIPSCQVAASFPMGIHKNNSIHLKLLSDEMWN